MHLSGELGIEHLLNDQHIVTGGRFKGAMKSVLVTGRHYENLVSLVTM